MTRGSLTGTAGATSVLAVVGSALRFGRLGRVRRMAFWHVGARRLVVAVVERTADEPLLHACVSIGGEPQPPRLPFAPGIVEAARAVSACRLRHAVALDDEFCRIVGEDGPPAGFAGDLATVAVPVAGAGQARVEASLAAIETLMELFRQAHLSLDVLDCGACATMSLGQFLGRPLEREAHGGGLADVTVSPAFPDPLAAVSVAPQCEAAAAELGAALTVPVGLALGVFGLVTDADR